MALATISEALDVALRAELVVFEPDDPSSAL